MFDYAQKSLHHNTGMSRSVTHWIAYLMKHQDLSLLEALQFVREKRLIGSPDSGFMHILAEVEIQRHQAASINVEVYRSDRFASSALLQYASSVTPSNTSASTRYVAVRKWTLAAAIDPLSWPSDAHIGSALLWASAAATAPDYIRQPLLRALAPAAAVFTLPLLMMTMMLTRSIDLDPQLSSVERR
eukprot:12851-Heterococcus_DN1.PRE.1